MTRRSLFASIGSMFTAPLLAKPKTKLPTIEFNAAEVVAACRFYDGEQWPKQLRLDRMMLGRPCLTFNKMPLWVERFMDQHKMDERQRLSAIVRVYRQSADTQRLINYSNTCKFEIGMLQKEINRWPLR